MDQSCKIGLFGAGLESYWEQFPGLHSRLEGYLGIVYQNLKNMHPNIVNAGLVDNIDKAFEAGKRFRTEDVDLIFLYVSTYALSSNILPVVKKCNVPVIILNLSPSSAIDYDQFNQMNNRTEMTAEWLAHCSSCAVPEIANVFKRTGVRFFQVTGILNGDATCWQEVSEWIDATKVSNKIYYNRLGCMGNYYSGMLDVYTDLTLQLGVFGGSIEIIEVDELSAIRSQIDQRDILRRVEDFHRQFEITNGTLTYELERAAKTSLALDQLVEKYRLGSFTYYYKGTGSAVNEDTMSSIILGASLLTQRGIPVAGEYEIKNVQAMKIMDCFGAGGSFTEYYAMDFNDDVVLMGHDGPGHIKIAEGKIKVRPLQVYHGKVGSGVSVEMAVKHGPVTLLSVVENGDGKLKLLVAEAESVAGPILEIGNTNSRYRFSIGAKGFVNDWNSYGPAHHCAVGTGHIGNKIKKLGDLLDIEVIIVC